MASLFLFTFSQFYVYQIQNLRLHLCLVPFHPISCPRHTDFWGGGGACFLNSFSFLFYSFQLWFNYSYLSVTWFSSIGIIPWSLVLTSPTLSCHTCGQIYLPTVPLWFYQNLLKCLPTVSWSKCSVPWHSRIFSTQPSPSFFLHYCTDFLLTCTTFYV